MYYVYCYKDPETMEPFYIGKGKWDNKRHLDHLRAVKNGRSTDNHMKDMKIKSILDNGLIPAIEIIQKDMDEESAYTLEETLIAKYGRRIDESGILMNILTDSRPPSHKGKTKSKEHRQRLSEAHTGKVLSKETKRKIIQTKIERYGSVKSGMEGKHHSEATKLKISKAKQGKTQDPASNQKRSDALKGIAQDTVTCPQCGKTGGNSPMKRWHFDNCSKKTLDNTN